MLQRSDPYNTISAIISQMSLLSESLMNWLRSTKKIVIQKYNGELKESDPIIIFL